MIVRATLNSTAGHGAPFIAALVRTAARTGRNALGVAKRRAPGAARLLVLAALLALYAAVLAGHVGAQAAPELTPAEEELAHRVAKVAANEASLQRVRPAEVALIWQTTEHRAPTTLARIRWLTAHSSCVLTDRPMTEAEAAGNCRWSRHLRRGGARPEGWPRHLRWDRYRPRWEQVQAFARALVSGRAVMRPCPAPPFTWGGRTLDMRQALARGLRPLGCRDPQTGEPTINEGFTAGGGAS